MLHRFLLRKRCDPILRDCSLKSFVGFRIVRKGLLPQCAATLAINKFKGPVSSDVGESIDENGDHLAVAMDGPTER